MQPIVWKNELLRLSFADKCLPLAILLAMTLGILLSEYVPSSRSAFEGSQVIGVPVPLAIGMIIMMLPPLFKVRWENFFRFFSLDMYLRQILVSVVLNWVLCPLLMFGLSWATLFDKPEYRNGIIMIGLARCIAMVLVWNDIAGGDLDLCAVIVIVNSMLQIVMYAPYQILFCYAITGDYSKAGASGVTYSVVAKSVIFFLGIPLAIGLVVRLLAISTIGINQYNRRVMPYISPWALIGLIYTIVVIFIERGHYFIRDIGSGIRCFVPLTLYFFISWFGVFFGMRWYSGRTKVMEASDDGAEETLLCGCEKNTVENEIRWKWRCGASYSETVTQTFTSASNNFELSLAIAISLYGSGSKESIAATFGPLLEVPILLVLCFVAQYYRLKFLWRDIDRQGHKVNNC